MKNIILILLVCFSFTLFSSCSDSDYADRYVDPSLTLTVSPEKLMTGVFYAGNTYTQPTYWRYYTLDLDLLARLVQTVGWVNSTDMYTGGSENYKNDRWTNFYYVLTQYRLLEHTYANMEDLHKPTYEVFGYLAQIFLYDHLQQILDMWGDVPYSEAGYLAITGDIVNSYPGYDDDEVLYKMILDNLKTINNRLAEMSFSSQTSTMLSAQDYINGGDIEKWRKYCNSLRLRVASRLADHGSLVTEARNAIKEMLENPSQYPVIESNDENIIITADKDGFDIEENVYDAFTKDGKFRASYAIINALDGDPRLEVMYDENTEGIYAGLDPRDDSYYQQSLFNRTTEEGGNYWAAIDTATFGRNRLLPGIIISASEVSFIKAEAYLKWGVSGNVQEAFEKGVAQSIEYYYSLNAMSTFRDPVPVPAPDEIAAFATAKWDEATNKEEVIIVQKWLNFGFLQPIQSWGDYRRTGYPELFFQSDPTSSTCPEPPVRFIYQTDERNYNAANYAKMQAQDSYYNKLFWAKP